MSVCGCVLIPSEHNTQTDPANQELSSVECELRKFDECRSWSLFYERIQHLASTESRKLTLSAANEIKNRWKNRYRDIVPYDETRVILENESIGDYINANFVSVKEVPSRRYILTQGPLLQTAGHFWQMVWEQKCPVIIMLNRFTEKGTLKCCTYFPRHTETLEFPGTNYSVSCISETNKGLYTLRNLEIVNSETDDTHKVLHFHYTRWPDFGVPDYSSSMLNLLWDVRRTGALNDPDRPGIVHCSAGVGRSGTFVLIDLALAMIEKKNSMEGLDVPRLLIQLRQCRMGIIQTAQQLRYSYAAVVEGGKLLLSTPPGERDALVFSEHNGISSDVNQDDNSASDTDDETDSGSDLEDNDLEAEEVDIQGDEREVLRCLRTRAPEWGGAVYSNNLFSLNSSSASTDEESEVEIKALFNQHHLKSHHGQNSLNESHFEPSSVLFEEIQNAEVKASVAMPLTSFTGNDQVLGDEFHQPTSLPGVSSETALSALAREDTFSVDDWEEEEEKVNIDKKVMEKVAEERSALELIRQLNEARLARQVQTRARLAEVMARMSEKNIIRSRWLPEHVAQPLRTFFTRAGYFNNLVEAILFSLGVVALLVAVFLGFWWHDWP